MDQSNKIHHFFTHSQFPNDVDINNLIDPSTLSSDEFRMYTYKIAKCPRIRSHDWTSCPLAHNGERAKRRDFRYRYYTAIPCIRFKTGDCPKGDLCEFAHGVFEFWLHPAKYRTRKCHAGEFCRRSICFFAHNDRELRPETMYRWYKVNADKYTIGYESGGRIVLPFLNGQLLENQASTSYDTMSNVDNVADSLARLNIKDGRYELPKFDIGQSSKIIEASSSSTIDYLNLDDLPPELNWITDLVRDT